MSGIDWGTMGQAAGIVGLVIVGAYSVIKGALKGDGKPPPERAPGPHEIRELMADLRRIVERHHELTADDLTDVKRALDRIEAAQRLQDAMAGMRREFNSSK